MKIVRALVDRIGGEFHCSGGENGKGSRSLSTPARSRLNRQPWRSRRKVFDPEYALRCCRWTVAAENDGAAIKAKREEDEMVKAKIKGNKEAKKPKKDKPKGGTSAYKQAQAKAGAGTTPFPGKIQLG